LPLLSDLLTGIIIMSEFNEGGKRSDNRVVVAITPGITSGHRGWTTSSDADAARWREINERVNANIERDFKRECNRIARNRIILFAGLAVAGVGVACAFGTALALGTFAAGGAWMAAKLASFAIGGGVIVAAVVASRRPARPAQGPGASSNTLKFQRA
jgi:hypothetical protein